MLANEQETPVVSEEQFEGAGEASRRLNDPAAVQLSTILGFVSVLPPRFSS